VAVVFSASRSAYNVLLMAIKGSSSAGKNLYQVVALP
jgi:hypothetical protein